MKAMNLYILLLSSFTCNHARLLCAFYRAMLAQSAVMRLHVVRLSVCDV